MAIIWMFNRKGNGQNTQEWALILLNTVLGKVSSLMVLLLEIHNRVPPMIDVTRESIIPD